MNYENVKNAEDALVYLTEGNLDTVVIMAFDNSRNEQEYIGTLNLAQLGIDFIKQFGIVVFNSRINEVIESGVSVKEWAKRWEEHSEFIFHNPLFGK
jgi:hypothetical protein